MGNMLKYAEEIGKAVDQGERKKNRVPRWTLTAVRIKTARRIGIKTTWKVFIRGTYLR